MKEEGIISMNEFKVVVEKFEDNQKKMFEYMQLNFDEVKADIRILKQDVMELKQDSFILKKDMSTVKEEIGLLHEGQTAIRTDLRKKVSYDDFETLEKRVAESIPDK